MIRRGYKVRVVMCVYFHSMYCTMNRSDHAPCILHSTVQSSTFRTLRGVTIPRHLPQGAVGRISEACFAWRPSRVRWVTAVGRVSSAEHFLRVSTASAFPPVLVVPSVRCRSAYQRGGCPTSNDSASNLFYGFCVDVCRDGQRPENRESFSLATC